MRIALKRLELLEKTGKADNVTETHTAVLQKTSNAAGIRNDMKTRRTYAELPPRTRLNGRSRKKKTISPTPGIAVQEPSNEGRCRKKSDARVGGTTFMTHGPTVCQRPTEIRGKEPCRAIKSLLAHAQLDFIYDSNRSPRFLEDEFLKVIHEIYWWL